VEASRNREKIVMERKDECVMIPINLTELEEWSHRNRKIVNVL
jgi:hypothetical protein